MDELKKYTFQGLEFTAKKMTLEVRTSTKLLRMKWEEHYNKYVGKSIDDVRAITNRIKQGNEKGKAIKKLKSIIKLIEKDDEGIKEAMNELKSIDDNESEIVKELKEKLVTYIIKNVDTLELFLMDATILKELFNAVLDGDINKIDYDVSTDPKFELLKEFSITVFNDFFLPSKKVKEKQ